jgi:cell division septation protein DedD
MRTPLAWALLVVVSACADRPERADGAGALAPIPAGSDPIVLRVSQEGGLVTALAYPGLDSVVWRSSYRVPPLVRALGYDPEDGYLTAVDTAGRPVRLDLRLGAVAIPGAAGGQRHASADGGTVFAINADGEVARYTPVGDRWSVAASAEGLVPLRDGSLILAQRGDDDRVRLRRVRPPDTVVVDSLVLEVDADRGTVRGVALGDRVFLSAGSHLLSLRTREFMQDVDVNVGGAIQSFVPSPSGDRVFVITDGREDVTVVDRFSGKVDSRIALPGTPRDLRVDPLGRALLVRGDADVVWVVDVGTATLVGAVRSSWRGDLPLVLPDGAIALVHGDTVALTSSIDLGLVRSVPDGAKDFWYAMRWNGFRPRASGIDEPVRFRASGENARSAGAPTLRASAGSDSADSAAATDSTAPVARDSAAGTVAVASRSASFTVQLAAVLSESLAQQAATGITVDGRAPRITTSVRDGRTLYRVVLGPYPSRDEAERVGKATGRTYWVFEGAP